MAFTTVNGKITRTFFDGKGAEVTESWQQQGETKTKRWAAFFDQPHGLSEGDIVEVSGMHGDKVDEWTDKEQQVRHTVKRTLNKAKLNGPQQPVTAPADEPWAATPPASGDVSNGGFEFEASVPF